MEERILRNYIGEEIAVYLHELGNMQIRLEAVHSWGLIARNIECAGITFQGVPYSFIPYSAIIAIGVKELR